MNYLDNLLRETFPRMWGELTDRQRLLVALDVLEMAETEESAPGLPMRVPDAAVTLRSRIGGDAVLPSYARSLEAGYDRNNRF